MTRIWRGGRIRGRRRIAVIALVVVGAATITTTAMAWTASSQGGAPRHSSVAPSSTGTAEAPAPGETPTPDGTTTSTATAERGSGIVPAAGRGEGDGARPAPDGRISLEQLTAVPVDLPVWGSPVPGDDSNFPQCPTRGVRLNHSDAEWKPAVMQLGYGDVDRDGAVETVARLDCPVYQAARQQVVAFDRDAAGTIVTLGQVLRQGAGAATIKMIYEFVVEEQTGVVRVRVGDRQPCCGANDALAEHQWRRYAWKGRVFAQVGGPTAFHPVPTSYGQPTPSLPPLELGPASGGQRTGSVTVTITNHEPDAAPGVRVDFAIFGVDYGQVPASVRITARGAACASEQTLSLRPGLVCHSPSLAAGASFTIVVTVTSPVANDGVLSGGSLEASVSAEQPGIRVLIGHNEGSTVRVPIGVAG